jgi:hypothetical protein
MHARRWGVALAVLSLVSAGVVAVAAPASASGKRTDGAYVALGDSFSSGLGLVPYERGTNVAKGKKQNNCRRSATRAYSRSVLPNVTDRAFWACSGASIKDMTNTPGTKGTQKQYGQPKQTATIGPDTKYITLTAGAEDVGLSNVTNACAIFRIRGKVQKLSTKSCSSQLKASSKKLKTVTASLASLYLSLLKNSAPDSELVVAGYPSVFASSYKGLSSYKGQKFCTVSKASGLGSVGFTLATTKSVQTLVRGLNSSIKAAIAAVNKVSPGRIMYSDVYATSVPLSCKGGSPTASVGGISLTKSGKGIGTGWKRWVKEATLRPTKAGQKLYATALNATFAAFSVQRQMISFDSSTGTNSPPSQLGPYTMTAFQGGATTGSLVTSISSPRGPVGFSMSSRVYKVGPPGPAWTWKTWSNGYTGLVYHFGKDPQTAASVTLTFPAGTKAVYFYAEPNALPLTYDFVATANNGTSSGHERPNGNSGATYFGFFAALGQTIKTITVSSQGDFGIGEFGIA